MSDSEDEIEFCQVLPHNEDENVKSKAVVKISTNQIPSIEFHRLEAKTDLNLPPSNWLYTSNSLGSQIHQAVHGSVGFASFRMAHMFADCLGDVDVVSDAENIKKLLELPYSRKNVISMMIHKIGNAILIDEFDIQKYLLRKTDDDWNWLREFIHENILNRLKNENNKNVCLKDKSREAIYRKNLLSKFLYYTIQQSTDNSAENNEETSIFNINIDSKCDESTSLPLLGPILPELEQMEFDENVPDPKSSHTFNRNVIWTFEDIRMLIGTDMAIFGGGTRPCISLRLREMTKPINVLTGIDYWLDNLMCNVPEVVMCYHLDGIVQKYELIKTEDLPYLQDSQFSPHLIRNVAQNILSFLKSNATKAGHTYWLFKGKNDDVVKLYDLTTLTENASNNENTKENETTFEGNANEENKNDNPFTIPVGMLLYTVARNIKNTSKKKVSPQKAGSIKALLENCIQLLPKEKYPQIVTSSHYILADLYVPNNIDPKCPDFESDLDSDTQSAYDEDFEYDESDCESDCGSEINGTGVAIKNISDTLKDFTETDRQRLKMTTKRLNRPPSPLQVSLDERCKKAIQHVSEGLNCCQFFTITDQENRREEEKRKRIIEELHPNMAKPFQPIPLPYERLLKQEELKIADPDIPIPLSWIDKTENKISQSVTPNRKKKSKAKTKTDESNQKIITTSSDKVKLSGSWDVHLRSLLLEKACLTFACQAESNYVEENYGNCLKCIDIAVKFQESLSVLINKYSTDLESVLSQKSCLFGRAGDCFFQIVKNWSKTEDYCDQYKSFSTEYEELLEKFEDFENNSVSNDISFTPAKNIEESLVRSCQLYEKSLEYANDKSRPEIIRRLGSCRNELGLKYMYCAQEEYTRFGQQKFLNNDTHELNESSSIEEPRYQILSKKSYDSLSRGIQAFEQVNDTINLAFLLCNMGRFMRYRAHVHFSGEDPDDMMCMRKKFYQQSFSYYHRALSILENRKHNEELWDVINWELSTALFTLGKEVQDSSTKKEISSEDVEKEIIELLQKALKSCDTETPGPRKILYNFRSGLIYGRLASFYHSKLRRNFNDDKKNLQLCNLYYQKAVKILETLKETKDFLTIQLERVALHEFLAEVSGNNNQKSKHFQQGLEIFLQSGTIIGAMVENDIIESQISEINQLLKLFENRLQNSLKTLTKLSILKNEHNKNVKTNVYKIMFSKTLNRKKYENLKEYAKYLAELLVNINSIKISN